VYSAGMTLHIDPVGGVAAVGDDRNPVVNPVVNAMNVPAPNNQAVLAQSNVIQAQVSEVLTMMRTQHKSLQRKKFYFKNNCRKVC
jgi:hypothetical protein